MFIIFAMMIVARHICRYADADAVFFVIIYAPTHAAFIMPCYAICYC